MPTGSLVSSSEGSLLKEGVRDMSFGLVGSVLGLFYWGLVLVLLLLLLLLLLPLPLHIFD